MRVQSEEEIPAAIDAVQAWIQGVVGDFEAERAGGETGGLDRGSAELHLLSGA